MASYVCVLYSFPMSICEGRRSLILNQQRELEARYSFLEDTEKKYLKRDMFNGFICHSCLLKEKPNRVCRRIMQIRCSASEMPYYFAWLNAAKSGCPKLKKIVREDISFLYVQPFLEFIFFNSQVHSLTLSPQESERGPLWANFPSLPLLLTPYRVSYVE